MYAYTYMHINMYSDIELYELYVSRTMLGSEKKWTVDNLSMFFV